MDFKKIQENITIERVFQAAKAKLIQWYTLGGLVFFRIGLYGISQVVSYSKDIEQKKLNDIDSANLYKMDLKLIYRSKTIDFKSACHTLFSTIHSR